MKGISTTLLVVMTAIVLLITALALVVVMTGGLGNLGKWTSGQLSEAAKTTAFNSCTSKCTQSCLATGNPPSDYTMQLDLNGDNYADTVACATGVITWGNNPQATTAPAPASITPDPCTCK